MAQQTLTGNAKTLGATASGGTVEIFPSEYPQVIGGVTLSGKHETATIDANTGDFSISVTKGAKIVIRCKDSLGNIFVNSKIQITSDNSANLSSYLPTITTPAEIVGDYVSSFNTRTGDVTTVFGDISGLTTSATAKTSLVDADQVLINDSAASNLLKKITWSNVKAAIKTYTDTLYRATTDYVFGTVTNNTTFEADGSMQMNGTATVWKDLTTPIISAVSSGPGVSISTAEQAALFVQTADLNDYVPIAYQLNHDWKSGSVVYPHIHFEQTTANMPNWLIRYRWQINGGAKVTSWTDYKCNTGAFTYVSGTLNQIAYGAGITPPVGYSISDIIQIRIFRDTGNTSLVFTGSDPVAATQNVTAADIHYEIDTIGSRTEYTK